MRVGSIPVIKGELSGKTVEQGGLKQIEVGVGCSTEPDYPGMTKRRKAAEALQCQSWQTRNTFDHLFKLAT